MLGRGNWGGTRGGLKGGFRVLGVLDSQAAEGPGGGGGRAKGQGQNAILLLSVVALRESVFRS